MSLRGTPPRALSVQRLFFRSAVSPTFSHGSLHLAAFRGVCATTQRPAEEGSASDGGSHVHRDAAPLPDRASLPPPLRIRGHPLHSRPPRSILRAVEWPA